MPDGAVVSPNGMPAMTATTMPSRSAPLILRAMKKIVATMEMTPQAKEGSVSLPSASGVPPPLTMIRRIT